MLILALLAGATAAPVPPPPKALTVDLLVGTWGYEYGSLTAGAITFNADGGYIAQHRLGADAVYFGTWRIDRNEIVLEEWVGHGLGGYSGPVTYRFALDVRGWPRLAGTCGATRVVLRDRTP